VQLVGSLPELGDWSLDAAPTFVVESDGPGTLVATVPLTRTGLGA
jgi:hypothetical protein